MWRPLEGAEQPYQLADLELLENGRYFSWSQRLQDEAFLAKYTADHGHEPWLTSEGLTCELVWAKWWMGGGADKHIQFWTEAELSVAQLQAAEKWFWQQLKALAAHVPDHVKELAYSPDIAENGFAKYFSGFTHQGANHYRMYIDFSVLTEEVLTCWVQAIDGLSTKFGVKKIKIGI